MKHLLPEGRRGQVLIVLLAVAVAGPLLLPPFPGALVGCASLVGALCVFVYARDLRPWLMVAAMVVATLAAILAASNLL
jgi:hypothetical protein